MSDTNNEELIAEAEAIARYELREQEFDTFDGREFTPGEIAATLTGLVAALSFRPPVPAESDEGVWTCGHCGRSSEAHGMPEHPAYQCVYAPVWKPLAPAPTDVDILVEAIRLTVEYVGNDVLPAVEGWLWFDALMKVRPEVAQTFEQNPIRFPAPVTPQVTTSFKSLPENLNAATNDSSSPQVTSDPTDPLLVDAVGVMAFQGYGGEKGIDVFKRMFAALSAASRLSVEGEVENEHICFSGCRCGGVGVAPVVKTN